MASIVIRSAIIYFMLMIFLRIMGKRQIGELDVSELVCTLLISEIAAIPIDDPDIPLLNAVIPSMLILSAEILISTLKNKSERLKRAFEGVASYIIYKGRLFQKELDENRISINEVMAEMRGQGIGDIGEVEYAIIEANGKLSFITRSGGGFSHPVIVDGRIIEENARRIGWDCERVVRRAIEGHGAVEDIFLMTVSDDGEIGIIPREV